MHPVRIINMSQRVEELFPYKHAAYTRAWRQLLIFTWKAVIAGILYSNGGLPTRPRTTRPKDARSALVSSCVLQSTHVRIVVDSSVSGVTLWYEGFKFRPHEHLAYFKFAWMDISTLFFVHIFFMWYIWCHENRKEYGLWMLVNVLCTEIVTVYPCKLK